MAKENIMPSRLKTLQPQASETRKDQKGYQLPEEYSAQLTNQELDRLHQRINDLVTESTDSGVIIEDLVATGVALTDSAAAITRLNLLSEIMRTAGLLRRTK